MAVIRSGVNYLNQNLSYSKLNTLKKVTKKVFKDNSSCRNQISAQNHLVALLPQAEKAQSFAIKGRLIELPANLNDFTATQFGKRIIVKMWNANQ